MKEHKPDQRILIPNFISFEQQQNMFFIYFSHLRFAHIFQWKLLFAWHASRIPATGCQLCTQPCVVFSVLKNVWYSQTLECQLMAVEKYQMVTEKKT